MPVLLPSSPYFFPSLHQYSAEKEGRGQTISESLSRFKVPFLPWLSSLCSILHVASLLSCSSHSVAPSIPHRKLGHRTYSWLFPANELASHSCAHKFFFSLQHVRSAACSFCGNHSLMLPLYGV